MSNCRRSLRAAAAVVAATAAVSTGVGVASAQIPGVDPSTTVVVVGDAAIAQVAVEAPDLARGTVAVSIQNNTSSQLNCNGIRGAEQGTMTRAGTVTTSEIAARTVSYYAKYPHAYDPALTIPVGSSGSPLMTITTALGSVTGIMPGSIGIGLRPEYGEAGRIGELYTTARLAGQVGRISSVSVTARSATVLTVPLDYPSVGPRQDFQTGAVIGCQINGQDYIFAAYQGDATPSIPIGSISSSETGRFGS